MDPDSSGSFDLVNLEKVVKERGKDQESLQDLVNDLKTIANRNDGKITVKDLKHAMMTMGERMREQEVDDMLNNSELVYQSGEDTVEIEDFAKMIMNRI